MIAHECTELTQAGAPSDTDTPSWGSLRAEAKQAVWAGLAGHTCSQAHAASQELCDPEQFPQPF